jgi:hypothetical protein
LYPSISALKAAAAEKEILHKNSNPAFPLRRSWVILLSNPKDHFDSPAKAGDNCLIVSEYWLN